MLSFFGDGASKQGAFHETLNIASLWKLPVVFVMENNNYNVYTQRRAGGRERRRRRAARGEGEGVQHARRDRGRRRPARRLRDRVTRRSSARARARGRRSSSRSSTASAPTATSSRRPACRSTTPSTRRSRSSATSRSTRPRSAATRSRASARGSSSDGTLSAEEADAIAEAAREEMEEAVEFGLASPFPAPETSHRLRLRLRRTDDGTRASLHRRDRRGGPPGDGARRHGPLLRPEPRDSPTTTRT